MDAPEEWAAREALKGPGRTVSFPPVFGGGTKVKDLLIPHNPDSSSGSPTPPQGQGQSEVGIQALFWGAGRAETLRMGACQSPGWRCHK